jgi:hypothetical protein
MTDSGIIVTERDLAAWAVMGPGIFHGEMTGPEAFARHAAQARLEERAAIVEWLRSNSQPDDNETMILRWAADEIEIRSLTTRGEQK